MGLAAAFQWEWRDYTQRIRTNVSSQDEAWPVVHAAAPPAAPADRPAC